MTLAETVETTRLCRAPPHTIADVGPIGGGAVPECTRHVLEVVRRALETGVTRRHARERR